MQNLIRSVFKFLCKEDFPSLNEVIALVIAEESRRGIMLEPVITDGSTMVAKGDTQELLLRQSLVHYCKKPHHTKDCSWKLHGNTSTSRREWGQLGESKNLH